MTDAEYAAMMREQRRILEDFARVLDEVEAGGEDAGPFVPSRDAAFWRDFGRIEAAGRGRDEDEVSWLAGLTHVDDLGPNGRAMFLAHAALRPLGQMPEATLVEGKALLDGLAPGASAYRKVGVCLVLEASALPDAGPLIEGFTDDAETYVRREARWCLERFRERTGEQEKE